MKTQMKLGDFFNYNPIILLVTLIAFFILTFLLPVFISNINQQETINDIQNDLVVPKKKKLTTIILQIISMIIILTGILFLNREIYLLLFIIPFLLEKLIELFKGIQQLHGYLNQDNNKFTPQGKACVTAVAIFPLLLSNLVPQEIKQIEIKSDIMIVFLMIVGYLLLWGSIIWIFGIFIGEVARILHKRKHWREIYCWTKLKGFQSVDAEIIWEKGYHRLINLHKGSRFFLIPIFYILCLIPNIVCMLILLIQRLIIVVIIVLAYLVRFLEYLFDWIAECSDQRFIKISIKIALVVALLSTEFRLVMGELVRPEIQSMYDYISGVILIPFILSEILEFKERYRREV